jgi:hypothetical protein
MALEAGGKCEWVLGHYLILRKTYGSRVLFFFPENIWKETKNLWLCFCCCLFCSINFKNSGLKKPKF